MPIFKHQESCEGTPVCKLNASLLSYFLAREFEYLKDKSPTDEQKVIQDKAAAAFDQVAEEKNSDCEVAYSHITEELEPVNRGLLGQKRQEKLEQKEAKMHEK